MYLNGLWVSLLVSLGCVTALPVMRVAQVGALIPSETIPEAFVSYSIEFSSFPDFAGNLSNPNLFSNNLLNNLGAIIGTKPYIRVGGNTQDFALYDPDLQVAINGTITSASPDYPTVLFIGKSYFESYQTWPGARYIHGFNLGKNNSNGDATIQATAPLACAALSEGRLLYWELGNEPDLFKLTGNPPVRPSTWTEQDYVNEWIGKTRVIRKLVGQNCPESPLDFIAPSLAGVKQSLDPETIWTDGLNVDKDIKQISSHNYISGANVAGVTLQKTLMNHTSTVNSVANQVAVLKALSPKYNLPFILGETNSLYNQGRPGLSNTFGAALWVLDFNLYCASQNIKRTHMHMGTNYRYASWQPVSTFITSIGTKAPYYGNMAVAATLGNLKAANVSIANIEMANDTSAAYGIYENNVLKRVSFINMQSYNYSVPNPIERPTQPYQILLTGYEGRTANILRLWANGSDAVTGITWDGWSYNYELDEGRPVKLNNVTTGEKVTIGDGGVLEVDVPWSSAALVSFPPEQF